MFRGRVALCAVAAVSLAAAAAACSFSPVPLSPTPTPEDLADEIRFRTTVGLRADEPWIRLVARDVAAQAGINDYGVPLTAAEKAALDARAGNAHELGPILEEYGRQQPEEWAGAYIESAPNGVVVAQFTGNVPKHGAAIARLVNPKSRYRLALVRFSLRELKTIFERISADQAFLRSIDADHAGGGVDIRGNRIALQLATSNERAPELVREKFALDEAQIAVELTLPPWRGGVGTLIVRAIDDRGRPVQDLLCDFKPDVSGAYHAVVGIHTQEDGTCRERVGATRYTVEVEANVNEGEWKVVGRGRVTVQPNQTAVITIVIPDPS